MQRTIQLTVTHKTGRLAQLHGADFCAGRADDGFCDRCEPADLACEIRVLASANDARPGGMLIEADELRRCCEDLVNDRSCEGLAAQIGERALAKLKGTPGVLLVQVTLTHPNGDEVEWSAEAGIELEIEGNGEGAEAVLEAVLGKIGTMPVSVDEFLGEELWARVCAVTGRGDEDGGNGE